MNKAELVAQVATKTGQPVKVVTEVVDAVVDGITETVAAGGSATIVGFGTFTSVARTARQGRNPKTGEPLQLSARTVPKFIAGSVFKAKVKNGH